ncbi:MAG: hypothetical protein ICV67_04695 [Thermoleophilia bacterium]|nr:hypothetical protein [Thermoleophilia bacterium]
MTHAWPFAERPRVLVEHPDAEAGLELAGALRDAGYAVAVCRGPGGGNRCPLHGLEPCAIVDGADLVVTALEFDGPTGRDVLKGLRLRYPGTPLVVAATAAESIELAEELHGCVVVPVDAEPERIVDVVKEVA